MAPSPKSLVYKYEKNKKTTCLNGEGHCSDERAKRREEKSRRHDRKRAALPGATHTELSNKKKLGKKIKDT